MTFRSITNERLMNAPLTRRGFAKTGTAATAAIMGLSLGGHSNSISAQDATSITWSTWGNPGEVERFREYTEKFNQENPDIQAELIPVPTDYESKLLTQLNGGTAPDVFYVGDASMTTFIETGAIVDITDMMNSEASEAKPEEFAEGVWGAARTEDGRIYGASVDCNPLVLWYNKTLLEDAGVGTMPADSYEAGDWTWDTFLAVCQQLKDAGNRPFVFGGGWTDQYSWASSNGGTPWADGQYVANEDPKFVESVQMLLDNLNSDLFTFTGTLPQGQGADALLLSGQLGFASFGRWVLPLLRENPRFEYDVVPYPTNTGNNLEPAALAAAYISINAASEAQEEGFRFLTNFVSAEGQAFRLQGSGNAVPSIVGEADSVVTEGDEPAHSQYFLDTRDVGFALYREEGQVAGLSTSIAELMDELFLEGGDVQEALDEIAAYVNERIEG